MSEITTRGGYKSPSGRNRERSNLRNGPVIRPSSHAYRDVHTLRVLIYICICIYIYISGWRFALMLNARLYRVGARRTRVCGLPRCTAMHDARDALALTPASAPYLLSLSSAPSVYLCAFRFGEKAARNSDATQDNF